MQTISIISLKGGVAKTTTAVNMAYTLAAVHNKKVLIIDNDKQGNTSKAFKKYDTEDKNTVARMMLERNIDVSEIIKKTDYENIDIITANMDLLEANLRTIVDTGRQQQTRFKKALSNSKVLDHGWAKFDYLPLTEAYDYCIIDNAPDINMSIINALVTSNDVIVPVFMDQYSFDGLDILMEQIAQVQEDFNENLHFAGCVITQYQNNDVNNQGIEWLKAHNVPVFNQWIRRTEKKVNESTCADFEIDTGTVVETKATIKKMIIDGSSIYDIIMMAYTKAARQTGKKYICRMEGKKLTVKVKGTIVKNFVLADEYNITNTKYEETIDSMVNVVKIYDENKKQVGEVKNGNWIDKYGIYQQIYTKEKGINAETAAKNMLSGVEKKVTLDGINGDLSCIAGNGVEVYDKATGLNGVFWIDSDTHTWENGTHIMSLELNFKNIMDSKEYDETEE